MAGRKRKYAKMDSIYKLKVNEFIKLYDTGSNSELKPRSGHRIECTNTALFSIGGYNPHNAPGQRRQDGRHEEKLFCEVWRFDFMTSAWRKLNTENLPCELASCATVRAGRLLFLYGGTGLPFGEHINKSVYVCKLPATTEDIKFEEIKPVGNVCPLPRYGQSVALVGSYLYTVGGTNGHRYSMDVYRLNMETCMWEQLYDGSDESSIPRPRYRHEIIHYKNRLYVLGGGTSDASFTLETIPAFNLLTRSWDLFKTIGDVDAGPECFPAHRRCHGCVQDPQNPAIVFVNGGYAEVLRVFNDTWRLDLDTLKWTRIPTLSLPHGTYFHSTAVTPDGRMIVFGGITNKCQPMQRTADVFSAWIRVPKLADACWDAVLHYIREDVIRLPANLPRLGLPIEYENRLSSYDQLSKQ